ncbi:MAG: mraW [Candidatus Saccharibacteria bacterium]|nr:mraW [Candidatus Saccharibacteria bacterium]
MSIKEHPPQQHVPVLLEASLRLLAPKTGESYLDMTAGYGGHARAFFAHTGNYSGSVLIDRDENALRHLSDLEEKGVRLLHTDFLSAARQLAEAGNRFDLIMLDLGVSSPQLDQSERGFSFSHNGPLDMRMDQRQSLTAHTLVNKASEKELADIIARYGEEPVKLSQAIARAIVRGRPLNTTGELAELIKHTVRGPMKRIHPATRTFQALRIAVNDELRLIEETLTIIPKLLSSGGRVGVISFHSLEDRLVKHFFKEQFDNGLEAELSPLTKRPIHGDIEDVHNPRARSSKLRVAVKK